jgi:hypothetical protein
MGIDQDRIKPFGSPLIGFAEKQVQLVGIISLPVIAGTTPKQSNVMVNFLVVDQPSTYNTIIGRPTLNKLKAVTSTYHLMMKFPTEEGVGELKGNQVAAKRCYNTSMKKVLDFVTLTVGTVGEVKGELAEPLEDIVVGEGKVLQIGTCLTTEVQEGLITFL